MRWRVVFNGCQMDNWEGATYLHVNSHVDGHGWCLTAPHVAREFKVYTTCRNGKASM